MKAGRVFSDRDRPQLLENLKRFPADKELAKSLQRWTESVAAHQLACEQAIRQWQARTPGWYAAATLADNYTREACSLTVVWARADVELRLEIHRWEDIRRAATERTVVPNPQLLEAVAQAIQAMQLQLQAEAQAHQAQVAVMAGEAADFRLKTKLDAAAAAGEAK